MSSTPVERVKAFTKAAVVGAVVTVAAFCAAVAFAPAVVAGAVLATGVAGTAALGFLNAVNVDRPTANCPPAGPAHYQEGKKGRSRRSAEVAQYPSQHHQDMHSDVSHAPSYTPHSSAMDSEYAGVGGGGL